MDKIIGYQIALTSHSGLSESSTIAEKNQALLDPTNQQAIIVQYENGKEGYFRSVQELQNALNDYTQEDFDRLREHQSLILIMTEEETKILDQKKAMGTLTVNAPIFEELNTLSPAARVFQRMYALMKEQLKTPQPVIIDYLEPEDQDFPDLKREVRRYFHPGPQKKELDIEEL